MPLIKNFDQSDLDDISLVGGKNASLGHLIHILHNSSIAVPDGFAVTTQAYRSFIDKHHLQPAIAQSLKSISSDKDTRAIIRASKHIRALIEKQPIPQNIAQAITRAYHDLSARTDQPRLAVAVRSSATAEDLPQASFAGLHESFLHIDTVPNLLDAWRRCISSLFTPRAIAYRMTNHIEHDRVALSVGIQQMVCASCASAGVMFTIDTETGFRDAIVVNAAYGLGESVVQGLVTPDTFYIHKPGIKTHHAALLRKILGNKKTKLVYAAKKLCTKPVSKRDQERFCLNDEEIMHLARQGLSIEEAYSAYYTKWTPMDIEWAKDGNTGKLYIVQARPETVHAHAHKPAQYTAHIVDTHAAKKLTQGQAIGQHAISGRVLVLRGAHELTKVKSGHIIVTTMTNPDWVPVLKRAAAIITDQGGRTCHAAIVSRELGIPAIVGTQNATSCMHTGQMVTVDCTQGEVGTAYDGALNIKEKTWKLDVSPKMPTQVWLNIAQPERAFALSNLPVSGVGLARTEFIVANTIQVHPLAIAHPKHIGSKARAAIKKLSTAYQSPREFFVETLAANVATIAAAFWPKPVYVRLSDFKTNEYQTLVGGCFFEPVEPNPMIGLRGVARYLSPHYRDAFELECAAMVRARKIKGLTNIHIMVPFLRTVSEAQAIAQLLAKHGLGRSPDLMHVAMCEVPSSALLIDQLCHYFDAFSIGSNDLTQLTLGIDRDTAALNALFDERNPAVKELIARVIAGAHKAHKTVTICGQAPSDYPDFAQWLIEQNIDGLSLNPDAVLPFILRYSKKNNVR